MLRSGGSGCFWRCHGAGGTRQPKKQGRHCAVAKVTCLGAAGKSALYLCKQQLPTPRPDPRTRVSHDQ